ncbi:MAG: cupin domain-containing protein [Clostridiaceae bacterium]|nr:cupin domain-containing protein [Clostridiaceae bacterium]
MERQNLFENLRFDPKKEKTELLFESGRVRIERICSSGQSGELYDQEEHEWVALLEGRAGIFFVDEGETVSLKSGDHLLIEAHRRHRLTFTSERCLWLCVFWSN